MRHPLAAEIKRWAEDPYDPVNNPDGLRWYLDGKPVLSLLPYIFNTSGYELRRPKKKLGIGSYAFPEPEKEEPPIGSPYYVPRTNGEVVGLIWKGDNLDHTYLRCGFVHLDESAAEHHLDALIYGPYSEGDNSE